MSEQPSRRVYNACIPVDVDVLEMELKDEVDKLLLNLSVAVFSNVAFSEQTERVWCLAIHVGDV